MTNRGPNYKAKKKNAYLSFNKKRKSEYCLEPGMKGFIVTCNNAEKQCIREAYNVLNKYADILYGPENFQGFNSQEENADDVETKLEKEISSLKASSTKTERRFQIVDSRAKNCLFIKTQISDPSALVQYIVEDINKTRQQCGRFLQRMLPIEITCKPYIEDVCKAAGHVLDRHFEVKENKGKTFAITFKARCNGRLDRDSVIKEIANLIHLKDPLCKADLKNSDYCVIVEVVCTVCCIGIVANFYKLKKFNVMELALENKATNAEEKNADVCEDAKSAENCSNEIKETTEETESKNQDIKSTDDCSDTNENKDINSGDNENKDAIQINREAPVENEA